MKPTSPPSPRRTPGSWLLRSPAGRAFGILGLALFFGALESAQGRFLYREIAASEYWPEALARAMPSWIILAALLPLALWVGRGFPIDRERWRIGLPVHLVAGAAFVCLHLGGAAQVASWRHGGTPSFTHAFATFFSRYAVVGLFEYWAIIGLQQVVRHQRELRERTLAEARLRESLAEAKWAALRAQLHPHFLFNALNSISALAMSGDRQAVVSTIAALSDLLRASLEGASTPFVSVATEMAFVDRYLEIQQVRFGSRLVVEREIEPEALHARVPSLILQPIVENAVVHGVATRREPGRVAITIQRDGAQLRLQVTDSGPGFAAGAPPSGFGVGIANVRERLEQLYPGSHGLEFHDAPGGGTRVAIAVPWALEPVAREAPP